MAQRRSAVARRVAATEESADEVCLTPGAHPERTALGRAFLPDAPSQLALAETFRALADPTRVSIVLSLLRQELCTCDLAAITGVTESAVSQHLRILRQLRLVKSRRDGRLVFYSLDDLHIRILLTVCLHHIRDDGQQHDRLERVLDFFPALLDTPSTEAVPARSAQGPSVKEVAR
jgi:ArsR family transcriptional regulator, lead/cadmium/zinc/bismuth-responsive transcriptional repressor